MYKQKNHLAKRALLGLLLFLTIQFSPTLHGNITQERAFYALSSLYHHLNDLTALEVADPEEMIAFSAQDTTELWQKALDDKTVSMAVNKAKKCYDRASSLDDQDAARLLYLQAKDLVKDTWKTLEKTLAGDIATATEEFAFAPAIFDVPQCSYPNFDDNDFFDRKMRSRIAPYLVPINHPVKPYLDALFRVRVTQNAETFAKAGFETISERPFSYAIIARHPYCPGYVFKLYLDTEKRKKHNRDGWEWLISRCTGADNVRRLIKSKQLKYFTVPDKFVYPLPHQEGLNKGSQPLVLIATDMNLASHEECIAAWKNANKAQIDELYCILSHGYASSYLIWNIPYTKSGKFACVDTEHPEREPTYKTARKFLSESMKEYFDYLVRTGKVR